MPPPQHAPTLRLYQNEDLDAVRALYRRSVETLAPRLYDPTQVKAWAACADDPAAWFTRLQRGITYLACGPDHLPLAFCQLDPTDRISLLYAAPEAVGTGLASRVYLAAETHARHLGTPSLRTEASHLGQPFFLRHGWLPLQPENVTLHGIQFQRLLMHKTLQPTAPLPPPPSGPHFPSNHR